MEISERIKQAREQAGLSQADIAHRVGVDVNSVWRWENGRVSPLRSIQKLAKALNTTTAYLLGETDTAPEPVIETKKMQPREGLPVPNERYIEEAAVNKRGELKYTFANGDKLEIPDTPEGRALFERMVFKNSSPETCLKKQ